MGIEGRYHWLGKLRDWLLDNSDRIGVLVPGASKPTWASGIGPERQPGAVRRRRQPFFLSSTR